MIFTKNITGLMALVLLWAACKKADIPDSAFNTPVFSVTYDTQGVSDPVTTAGVANVYLFTDFTVDNQQVVCKGSFADSDCPDADCPGTLTFEFKRSYSDSFSPDSVFHLGGYSFQSPDTTASQTVLRASFFAVNPDNYDTYSWRINDEDKGQGPEIVVDFADISVTPKLVELTAQRNTGLQSVVRRKVSLNASSGNNTFATVNISVSQDSQFIFRLLASTLGFPYDSLTWNTFVTDTVIHEDMLQPFYSVTVLDTTGNQCTASLEGLTPNDLPVQTANFSFDVENISIPVQDGEVAIEWIDADGVAWRSDGGIQETTAFFGVSESEKYEVNEKGQQTRKMRVEFNCRLYNPNGGGRDFSGSGVIAVAHPQ